MWVNQSVTYVGKPDPLCVLCALGGKTLNRDLRQRDICKYLVN